MNAHIWLDSNDTPKFGSGIQPRGCGGSHIAQRSNQVYDCWCRVAEQVLIAGDCPVVRPMGSFIAVISNIAHIQIIYAALHDPIREYPVNPVGPIEVVLDPLQFDATYYLGKVDGFPF